MKYQITEIQKVEVIYEIEADSEEEAEQKYDDGNCEIISTDCFDRNLSGAIKEVKE